MTLPAWVVVPAVALAAMAGALLAWAGAMRACLSLAAVLAARKRGLL
jgi:hypothetical protein